MMLALRSILTYVPPEARTRTEWRFQACHEHEHRGRVTLHVVNTSLMIHGDAPRKILVFFRLNRVRTRLSRRLPTHATRILKTAQGLMVPCAFVAAIVPPLRFNLPVLTIF